MVEVRSRNDRRSESKQSFVFIAFIITVAVVCFASGYMVGRNTAGKVAGGIDAENSSRKPIANKATDESGVDEKKPAENLTFYEALPKGEQPPLGSGINLPPKEKEQVTEVVLQKDEPKLPIPQQVFEPVQTQAEPAKAVPVKAPLAPVAKPEADAETVKYILQVASYPQPDEAGKLLGRLTQGGYDVYVQQADLGSKGTWYRVFVGPITGKSRAVALQSQIEKDIKVKPLLKKK